MKGNNQNNYDRRPIRIKDKYNPYTLFTIGVHTDDPHYYVSFVDVNNNHIKVEISKELFDLFDKFELEDLSYIHQVSHNIEHSNLIESTLMHRSLESDISVEEIIFNRIIQEELLQALSTLTKTQKRRIYLFFFERLSYKEISEMEGCGYQRIQNSINGGLKKIKQILIDRGVF